MLAKRPVYVHQGGVPAEVDVGCHQPGHIRLVIRLLRRRAHRAQSMMRGTGSRAPRVEAYPAAI